jgi:hypothetical protein
MLRLLRPLVPRGHRRSQGAFGGRHAGHPRVGLDGLAQRPRNRLVLGLGDVVRVAPVQGAHMQCDAGVERNDSKTCRLITVWYGALEPAMVKSTM